MKRLNKGVHRRGWFSLRRYASKIILFLLTLLLVTTILPTGAQHSRDEAKLAILDLGWGNTNNKNDAKNNQSLYLNSVSFADASSQLEQGITAFQAGRFWEAIELWQQATRGYQAQGDNSNQALILSYLSLAYQNLGQWQEAEKVIAQSLNLLQDQPNLDQGGLAILGQALNTQGRLQLTTGQAEAALETWKQAANTYSSARDEIGKLGSQINQAQALQALGMYQRAKTTLEQVEQQFQTQPNSLLKATGLQSLGVALQLVGNLEESQSVLEQSLAITQQLDPTLDTSAIRFNLGNVARDLQDYQTASEWYEQAAEATDPMTQLKAQLNQLSYAVQTEQWEVAQALLPQIQSQLPNLTPSRDAVYVQVNLAESWMKLSSVLDKKQSTNSQQPATNNIAQLLATAVQQARLLKDPKAESYALGQLGKLYEQKQQWSEAQNLTEQSLMLAQANNASEIAYLWQWQLGRILKQQGDINGAIAAYTTAVATLQSLRSDLVAINPDIQFSFRESVEPIYRELVSLLLQPPLLAKEMESVGSVGSVGRWGDKEDKEEGGEQVPIPIPNSQFPIPNSQFSIPSQKNLKQAREVIESLQLAELDNFFRHACLQAQPKQIDQIDTTAAVIYPIILPDRLAVILSLPEQPLHYYQTQLPQTEVESILSELVTALNPLLSDKERLRLSQQVYDWLIRPAEAQLAASGVKTLVFVLDGTLRNLPMAALHDGEQYLLEKYSIALSQGLQLLETRSLGQGQLQALTGGLSEARQGFSPLPAVESELDQIASEVPSEVLLNQEFNKKTLVDQISATPFPVVHLATHGQFSSKAEDTFIITWDDRINVKDLDQLLRAREREDSNPIELLVLSACQTATGDKRAALGLAGVALRSGARSTLATLWSVNDQSTAGLMAEFYRELAQPGVSKAEALRQAQLTLLQDPEYEHPFYWAPFVMVGNWL